MNDAVEGREAMLGTGGGGGGGEGDGERSNAGVRGTLATGGELGRGRAGIAGAEAVVEARCGDTFGEEGLYSPTRPECPMQRRRRISKEPPRVLVALTNAVSSGSE